MLVRAKSLSHAMSHYLVERIQTIPNIKIEPQTEVIEIHGEDHLCGITIRHHDSKIEEHREAGALFIFIGAEPRTDWLDGTVCRDAKGFILTGQNLLRDGKRPPGWTLDRDPTLLETNVPGVFAVGDVRNGAVRRVANSVGEGSIVLYFVNQYLANR
jgi:thioredoxin reductase (NADPH)